MAFLARSKGQNITFSLTFIASGRSSGQHPISSHSCWKYVRAGRPAFSQPYVGVHRSTSFMSSSLLLQSWPACPVRLTWIVFVMRGRWPYSWCLVGCCRQNLFNIARSILAYIYIYIYIYIDSTGDKLQWLIRHKTPSNLIIFQRNWKSKVKARETETETERKRVREREREREMGRKNVECFLCFSHLHCTINFTMIREIAKWLDHRNTLQNLHQEISLWVGMGKSLIATSPPSKYSFLFKIAFPMRVCILEYDYGIIQEWCGVVAKELDCDTTIREFELLSFYYVYWEKQGTPLSQGVK